MLVHFFRNVGVGLILMMTVFFSGLALASEISGQAADIPWSGYWWPFQNGGLASGYDYRGHPAPLEKYHMLMDGRTTGDAIDWYKDNYYDPGAKGWEGLCPAFATAAVQEAYPILPSTHDNIVFRVGDKKGLLTICHDNRLVAEYASGRNSPVDFHYWLLDYIGDQKKSFIADLYLGTEQVWFFPIYRYEMDIQQSGMTEHVTTTIFYADDQVEPDYMGTRVRETTYSYDLYLGSENEIRGGEWTGGSVWDHPDRLVFPISTGPRNPYLNHEKIRELAQARDDNLELPDNAPASLLPGTHNCVLLNEDNYILEGKPGEEVLLQINRHDGSGESMDIEIKDISDAVIHQETLSQSESAIQFRLSMENSPYKVSVSQENYQNDPNIYSLFLDFNRKYVRHVPYIPNQGGWNGFSLTNPGNQSAEIMLVTADGDRKPLQTLLDPLELGPGEKYLFDFSNLHVRLHEQSDTDALLLISDQPFELVNLFAKATGPMAGFNMPAFKSNRLIIPTTYDNDPWDPMSMNGAVANESFVDAMVDFYVYSEDGTLDQKVSRNIPARRRLTIRPGSAPFAGMPDGGWIEIAATDPSIVLTAHGHIRGRRNGVNSEETGFALPVSSGVKYIQHITPSYGHWQTRLTLINPGDEPNSVVIYPALTTNNGRVELQLEMEPFEKKVIDISETFGDALAAEWQRSILKVSGMFPLAGEVKYIAENGDAAAFPLLDADAFKSELVMPHSAYNNGRWWTGVGVCNPNNTNPIAIQVTPYDQSGQPMTSEYFDLASGAYKAFTVHQMFGALTREIAFLKIRSQEPDSAEIGGFYLYGNAAAQDLAPRKLVSGGNM